MRRRTFLGLTPLAGCARDHRPRLNVFCWSNYVAAETVPRFQAEFGVRVRFAVYESAEEMLAKVFGGNSGWDVVFPPNYFMRPMRELNLVAPLDQGLLPNLDHLDARFRSPEWDPKLEWGVPYMWGGTGIVYQSGLAPPPAAWNDLWHERLRGRLTMLDDPSEVLAACLLKIGLRVNSTDPGELERARGEALAQRPLVRAYLNSEAQGQLVAGDLAAAQAWATTAAQAMQASPRLEFCWPREGFPMYCDHAVILRESQRGALAHRFLNYLLRPEVAARVVEETLTATANGSVRKLLPASLSASPVLYPEADVLARGQWFEPMPSAIQRLRDRLWTEIKSA